MGKLNDIFNKLLGHDDGVEFGNGYHDDCKQEIEEAKVELLTLLEQAAPEKRPGNPSKGSSIGSYDWVVGRDAYNMAIDNYLANIREALK